MPSISITKSYQDGDVLLEADLDNIRDAVTTFLNTTKIDSDNIQAGGIQGSRLNSNVVDDSTLQLSSNTLKIKDSGVTRAKITAAERLPVGMIIATAGDISPTGWLYCDGSAVSRTTYADLFTAIGTRHGTGNGTTTFNLPDYRGMFLRGWADGTSVDPDKGTRTAMATGGTTGDNVGSVQTSANKSHTHDTGTMGVQSGGAHTHFTAWNGTDNATSLTSTNYIAETGNDYSLRGSSNTADNGLTSSDGTHVHTLNGDTGTSGGSESRPINANVKYLIKY